MTDHPNCNCHLEPKRKITVDDLLAMPRLVAYPTDGNGIQFCAVSANYFSRWTGYYWEDRRVIEGIDITEDDDDNQS